MISLRSAQWLVAVAAAVAFIATVVSVITYPDVDRFCQAESRLYQGYESAPDGTDLPDDLLAEIEANAPSHLEEEVRLQVDGLRNFEAGGDRWVEAENATGRLLSFGLPLVCPIDFGY